MIRFCTMLLLACCLAVPALAFESAPVSTRRSTATLITDSDSVLPGGRVRIALRLRLADGWHTYWRNPGEAGVPVELLPSLSPGATSGPIEWPAPGRILQRHLRAGGGVVPG
jgi:thiol:disulfide interchange protein DsbD